MLELYKIPQSAEVRGVYPIKKRGLLSNVRDKPLGRMQKPV